MQTNLLSLFFIFSYFSPLNAQGDKAVFLELGGHGFLYSVNYDFRFAEDNTGFGLTSGIEFYPIGLPDEYDGAIFSIGTGINKTWGENSFHPELGLGVNLTSPTFNDRWTVIPHAVAAIRFQQYHSNLFFRIAGYYNASFLYDFENYEGAYPSIWAGIGLGFNFN